MPEVPNDASKSAMLVDALMRGLGVPSSSTSGWRSTSVHSAGTLTWIAPVLSTSSGQPTGAVADVTPPGDVVVGADCADTDPPTPSGLPSATAVPAEPSVVAARAATASRTF